MAKIDPVARDLRNAIVYGDYPSSDTLERLDGHVSSEEIDIIRETAYRRGFVQGAHEACAALRAGHPLRRVMDWVTRLHLKWRCRSHRGKAEWPKRLL